MSWIRIGNEDLHLKQEGDGVHVRLGSQGVTLDHQEAAQLAKVADAAATDASKHAKAKADAAKESRERITKAKADAAKASAEAKKSKGKKTDK